MRNTNRAQWPTWRKKRAWASVDRNTSGEAPPREMTTDQMASDLVRRGLASPRILGPIPPTRTPAAPAGDTPKENRP